MVDDLLFSVKEMLTLLSKQNINIVHKKNGNFVVGQFISENTYIPLGDETESPIELVTQICEIMIELNEEEEK